MRLSAGVFAFSLIRLFILTIAAATMLCACQKPPEQTPREVVRPVKVITVAGSTGASRTLPGRLRAAERVELSFNVAGSLVELPAKQGTRAEQGALLGRLDQRDFKSNLDATRAEYNKARANFKRAKELIKNDYISQKDYDEIEARVGTTKAELEKARKALEDTNLIAPFAGIVARRYVENFTDVQAKQAILSLQDTSKLEIVVDVPEGLLIHGRDTETLSLTARFEAVPDRVFGLSIKEFATQADPKTQTFEYVLVMPEPEGINLLPGMTAMVTAVRTDTGDTEQPPIYTIPAVAIAADETGVSYVWVVDKSQRVQKRPVTTGKLTGDAGIEIKDGIVAGETIVVSGVSRLREGQRIRPVDRIKF